MRRQTFCVLTGPLAAVRVVAGSPWGVTLARPLQREVTQAGVSLARWMTAFLAHNAAVLAELLGHAFASSHVVLLGWHLALRPSRTGHRGRLPCTTQRQVT